MGTSSIMETALDLQVEVGWMEARAEGLPVRGRALVRLVRPDPLSD